MGIFNTTPVEIAKGELVSVSANLFHEIKQRHTAIYNKLWNPPEGVTTQNVLDLFGTDAASLFVTSQTLQNLMESVDATYERLIPPNTFVVNDDGTVTIGDPVE
tara:strand:+ start:163 stop:474 length:312 start_codon:yes stop_codon:yes gene_type:complete